MERSLLLLIVIFIIFFEGQISIPSCDVVSTRHGSDEGGVDLKAMVVADLMLLGSDAGYYDVVFRYYYLSKFFKKSFQTLKPDMLLVLGDLSSRGAQLSRSKWLSVLQQFNSLLDSELELPFHVVLGDGDIGRCSNLDAVHVDWMSNKFPGLDSAGCGAFVASNVRFLSLNSVALLCNDSKLRFSVERALERESMELQMENEHIQTVSDKFARTTFSSGGFEWRENIMSSRSGPVLLLHFPLHQVSDSCVGEDTNDGTYNQWHKSVKTSKKRKLVAAGPYELSRTLPLNASEYILQALRPRIILSAHAHMFCDHTHPDGTREVIVPAMSWNARNDPGFVFVTFGKNGSVVTVNHCKLASESHVLFFYISVLAFIILTILLEII